MAKFAVLGCSLSTLQTFPGLAWGQERWQPGHGSNPPTSMASAAPGPMFLPYAQFQIPFNVDPAGPAPKLVQLWVSTDDGASWQLHGSEEPQAKHFDFRAASEGLYLFAVHTVDASGASFPSNSPPLRVQIDTTKPQAAMRADIDAEGRLVVDVRVVDSYLDLASAMLRVRTDRDSQWKDVPVETLLPSGDYYESRTLIHVEPCREVGLVFVIKDQANNAGEATYKLTMPRTASAEQDMKLASTGSSSRKAVTKPLLAPPAENQRLTPLSALPAIAGATPWEPAQRPAQEAARGEMTVSPGRLVGTESLHLDLGPSAAVEELPLPTPEEYPTSAPHVKRFETAPLSESERREPEPPESDLQPTPLDDLELTGSPSMDGEAYHCKSLAFSLDYSVEALRGSALADVELWGTEDGGRTWHLWGSDPDRQSPFDVQVGNDGLFGFRMVIVGSNGVVSNRPKKGDSADVWINIDTVTPVAKITRAVYGEGPEHGMLVIDYTCNDAHLVDRPITLSFSQRRDGPWTTIATGLKNTGVHLWKADPNLPERIYLKIEVVDKAGNVGAHRLDLPIDIQGLAPRGRIQGFRPISVPGQ